QLEEFCQIISHNLRAPLSNLFLLGEMLAENHSLEDKFHYFEMQKPIIIALQKTFEELVDATQVKMDSTIKKGLINLDIAFDKAKKKFEEEILDAKITVTNDFTGVKTIFYSKKYIHTILTNLLSNAIRYRSLERPSKVHITSYKKDGWVCIDVKDNGLGIDMKKNRNHLFKLHKTFHNHPKAKGFGLFITKIQVEALGGNISAKSIVEQGSTFTVKLYKIASNEKN
ncbi:MAG TPA: HAMP domain-containing sensor histidine kinase, partial [Flavobacterium sp.]|nr:HAMP domain-containing sensor histidine kinase [Flavobacterium sp.]